MIEKTDKEKATHCPRCKTKFECLPGNISACQCSKIELSKEEYRFITSKFQECLCNNCLQQMKEEYNMKFHYNKPKNFKDRIFTLFFFLSLLSTPSVFSQTYAPPVGQAGTSAIYMDSSVFVNWASGCTLIRGYQDISNPSMGFTTVGDNTMATGKAQSNAVVSLGDGGIAICTFDKPITNGTGYDFAIFENGFDDVFLELAYVEVSSDGVNFFRFPAHSLTDTTVQTGSFGSTDAKKINNLAGKYRGGYGTPFDLQELSGKAGLDITNVTHVKIIDVVGNINPNYATRDSYHNKVNDPWPTAYASGGFDLDAVGVIHENTITSLKEHVFENHVSVYPNPVTSGEEIKISSSKPVLLELTDVSGKAIISNYGSSLSTSGLSSGIYCLKLSTKNTVHFQKIIVGP